MTEAQVIFRLDQELLESLDSSIKKKGFKTRNEWFRAEVRHFLEETGRIKALRRLDRLTVKDITEEEAAGIAMEWRGK